MREVGTFLRVLQPTQALLLLVLVSLEVVGCDMVGGVCEVEVFEELTRA